MTLGRDDPGVKPSRSGHLVALPFGLPRVFFSVETRRWIPAQRELIHDRDRYSLMLGPPPNLKTADVGSRSVRKPAARIRRDDDRGHARAQMLTTIRVQDC
jgi:hypothetical protein